MSDPQFVVGGPRIPSELIRALEEERLVFFCGAGISIGTDLPDFRQMTLEAIKHIDRADGDMPAHPAIHDAYCWGLYDKALDILEDLEGHTGDLRGYVARRLTKRLRNPGEQLRLHKALLDLSRLPASGESDRGYRLVTTNYDNRFEKAGLPRRWIEAAPRLSRPQASHAGYATFLHGRIETEKAKRDPQYKTLVLTSADFGDAYFRDGYAARFVLELFRDFTVLFIGYSLNDPVMRYLMDIFATENTETKQGLFRTAYALVAHGDGDAEHQRQLWQAKHVIPILYSNVDRHSLLTKTFESWAHIHRARPDGRFQMFMDVVTKPFQGDVDADDLSTAAWALADKGHKTARRLGSLDPKENGSDAEISWLGPLLKAEVFDPRDDRRPLRKCRLDDVDEVDFQLFCWAMRHLENIDLVKWAVHNQQLLLGKAGRSFFDLLCQKLYRTEQDKLVQEPFRVFWQLLIDVVSGHNEVRDWNTFWQMGACPAPTGDALRSVIERLEARPLWPALPFSSEVDKSEAPQRLKQLARYKISDQVGFRDYTRFRDIFSTDRTRTLTPRTDLALLVDDVTSVLLAVCRLGAKMDASFARGASRFFRESIVPDARNQLELRDWEWLIEALVQSFEAARTERHELAVCVARRWRALWRNEEQSLFGRLYLHAATHMHELSADEAILACLDQPDVLWRYEYEAEFLVLLRLRGSQIGQQRLNMLVERLISEPPHGVFPEQYSARDIDNERGQRFAELVQAGVRLDGRARMLADAYFGEHPPSEDPREDEVRYRVVEARWIGPPSGKELVGRNIGEVIALVAQGRDEFGFLHDQWNKSKQVADWLSEEAGRIAETLEALAGRDDTPPGFADGVFWALRDVSNLPEVIEQTAGITEILSASPSIIDESFGACAAWTKALAEGDIADKTFWPLWDLIRARAPADDPSAVLNKDMSLTAAINSAGGHLTEAVISRFWKKEPKVGKGLSTDVRDRLTSVVSGASRLAVHARLVCMPPLHALYAVDPDWTTRNLLGYLNWGTRGDEIETSALWSTHLSYGRWSLELMAALKSEFLICLAKREALDNHAYRNACSRFAALGIERPGFFTDVDIRNGFHSMGAEGACFVLGLFKTRLRESEQPSSQWREMIAPWLQTHWPRLEVFRTNAVCTAAAEMLLETREAFAEALEALQHLHLIGVINRDRQVLFRLARAEEAAGGQEHGDFAYATSFSGQVCRWLDRVLPPDIPGYEHHYLATVIGSIERNLPPGTIPACLHHLRERI